MRCPHCGSMDDRVTDSRTLANGESIRRRRECLSCGFRFTSYERIEEKPLMVVKRDDRREKRPVSQMTIENILNEIEDDAAMLGKGGNEVQSSSLGEMTLHKLYALDKVAYIRFASVYRKFESMDEFMQEIERLENAREGE